MPDRAGTNRKGLWSDVWVRISAALIALGVVAAVGGLLAVWLSDGDEGSSDFVFSGDVRIVSPPDRALVKGLVQLTVESPTYRVADPGEDIPGTAHFAVFVDIQPFTPSGEVIPREQGIYHFSTNTVELDLEPGPHRIIVALADNQDVRIPGATVTGITVTVE